MSDSDWATSVRTPPLRKVIETGLYDEYGLDQERLECGHIIRPPDGAWGSSATPAIRRRCRKCLTDA